MDLIISLPGLYSASRELLASCNHTVVPTLLDMIMRSRCRLTSGDLLTESFTTAFGLEKKVALSALCLQAHHVDYFCHHWLWVQPMSIQVGLEAATVLTAAQLLLPEHDAQWLARDISSAFAAWCPPLVVADAHHWFLPLSQPTALDCNPLHRVVGHNVEKFLCQGADRLVWQKRLQDIEMFLFSHPYNAQRRERGLPPVTGLWPSGICEKDHAILQINPASVHTVLTDNIFIAGAAHACYLSLIELSHDTGIMVNSVRDMLAHSSVNRGVFFWSDCLLRAAHDEQRWLQAIMSIERVCRLVVHSQQRSWWTPRSWTLRTEAVVSHQQTIASFHVRPWLGWLQQKCRQRLLSLEDCWLMMQKMPHPSSATPTL